jgi:hypothetical protein
MTSHLRVFAKSLHWLAAGWACAVIWLCWSQIRRGLLFDPAINYHVDTLVVGGIPSIVIEVAALIGTSLTGAAPTRDVEWREWWYSFVWALFPNVMIIYTVYLIVIGDL